MRLPESAHTSRPWRIHELTGDFELEDVWALPTPGRRDDFPRLVELIASFDPARSSSAAVRALFGVREKVGEALGWDEAEGGPDEAAAEGPDGRRSLHARLPADLRDGPAGPELAAFPFTRLYLTEDEWALEAINRTVHGVLHFCWVAGEDGVHRGQMAIYVKRNGLLGTAYMAAIAPFRHAVVYPRIMRELERKWSGGPDGSRRGLAARQ
jgi:hypothetical protein